MKQVPLTVEALAAASGLPPKAHWVLPQVDSTNTHLKNTLRAEDLADGAVLCITECQTAGRGRGGKTWLSPESGITFSLALSMSHNTLMQGGWSLVVGCALAQVLGELGVSGHGIKWPNDLLVSGKKLAGILVESQKVHADRYAVITGIGLNWQAPPDAHIPDQPFTYLQAQLPQGREVDRNTLVGRVCRALIQAAERYRQMGLACIADRWAQYDLLQGQTVRVLHNGQSWQQGVALGLAEDGALRVSFAGREQVVYSGEVSVRL